MTIHYSAGDGLLIFFMEISFLPRKYITSFLTLHNPLSSNVMVPVIMQAGT